MDLDFSPEQDMLRDAVRGVCTKLAGPAAVRRLENDPWGYSQELWDQLAQLGVVGMLIPQQWGGSGMSVLDGVVVYSEFGRSLAPSPHLVSSVLSGGMITAAGHDEQRRRWLPSIASGDVVITPAWLEPGRGFGPAGVTLVAEPDGDGYLLWGTKRHVQFASGADWLLVLAREGPMNPLDPAAGVVACLVEPTAAGVTLTQQQSIAYDTQYRVDFARTRVGPDSVLAGPGDPAAAWRAWIDVMHRAIVLLGAQAVGGARYALDITVQYAKDRKQFDKPLGAFQAIAHYLADAVTVVDGAETLVWEAAWAWDAGRPVNRLAPMAKLFACQTFRDVTAMAQQVFGGVGFTVDYDIQLYFRRAKQLQISWWDSAFLEGLVAAAVLDH